MRAGSSLVRSASAACRMLIIKDNIPKLSSTSTASDAEKVPSAGIYLQASDKEAEEDKCMWSGDGKAEWHGEPHNSETSRKITTKIEACRKRFTFYTLSISWSLTHLNPSEFYFALFLRAAVRWRRAPPASLRPLRSLGRSAGTHGSEAAV